MLHADWLITPMRTPCRSLPGGKVHGSIHEHMCLPREFDSCPCFMHSFSMYLFFFSKKTIKQSCNQPYRHHQVVAPTAVVPPRRSVLGLLRQQPAAGHRRRPDHLRPGRHHAREVQRVVPRPGRQPRLRGGGVRKGVLLLRHSPGRGQEGAPVALPHSLLRPRRTNVRGLLQSGNLPAG